MRLVDRHGRADGSARGRRAARGAGEPRRARRDLRGHAALRARLHDPPASTSRARSTTCSLGSTSWWTSHDHWEAFVMPYTRRALTLTSERTDARAAARRDAPRPSSTTSCSRTRCLALFCRLGRRFPALIPLLNRRLAGLMGALRAPGREQPRLREHAPGALHGDGVRDPARARGRGARARARADRAPAAADRLPDRAARSGPGRRAALDRLRAPRPPTSRYTSTLAWSSRPTSAPWRRSWTSTAAARTGESATTSPTATLRPAIREWDRFAEMRERFDPERRFENDYLRRVLG